MKKLALGLLCGALAMPAFAADHAKDDAAIKAQMAKVADAFNAKDAKLMGSLFAEDGDLINPAGVVAKGRAEIEKVFADDAEHIIAGGKSTFTVDDIRYVRADVAIVNAEHNWTGSAGPMPDGHVLVTVVVQKVKGKWLAVAARPMVPVKPPAPADAGAAPSGSGAAMTGPAPMTSPATAPKPAGGMGGY